MKNKEVFVTVLNEDFLKLNFGSPIETITDGVEYFKTQGINVCIDDIKPLYCSKNITVYGAKGYFKDMQEELNNNLELLDGKHFYMNGEVPTFREHYLEYSQSGTFQLQYAPLHKDFKGILCHYEK